jgi:hypothetical protein
VCDALLAAAQDDAFKQGLQARSDKKWADVVRHMQNALKADAQESTRKVGSRLGVGGTEYLPHFFLGEAYYNQQDCGGAVTEWSISEQQGAIKIKPEFLGTIKSGSQACAAKGVLLAADYNPLYQSTSKVYADAAALGKRISDIGTTNRDVWRPEVDEQFARAKKELEASFARLNAGQRSRLAVDFNEAKAGSERATAILRPLETSLNTAVEALNSVQRQTKDVEQTLASADTADQTLETLKDSLTEPMQAARKTGKQQLAQARDRLVAGQKTQNPAAVADALKYAQSASTTLTQILDQVQKAARGVFEQQLGDAIRVADEAFARVSGAMSILDGRIAQKPDIASPKLTADRAAYVKQVDGLRRKFERARKAEDLSGLAETTRLTLEAQNGVTGLITAFGPITLRERGVHESLEEGVRLYLNGEYQQGAQRARATDRTNRRAAAGARACRPRRGSVCAVRAIGRVQRAAAHRRVGRDRSDEAVECVLPAESPGVFAQVPQPLSDRAVASRACHGPCRGPCLANPVRAKSEHRGGLSRLSLRLAHRRGWPRNPYRDRASR